MGMMASLAAGANPHIVTRASWLFITTNSIKEAFVRQGALQQGIYISLSCGGGALYLVYIYRTAATRYIRTSSAFRLLVVDGR